VYFGFDVGDVVGVDVLVPDPVVGRFGSLTPCSVMQLRKAANAVELAPDFPANPPPPPKEPAGRRLAQALNAALALGLDANPPAGGVPPAPPAGGAPPAPPVGRFPVGKLTPCDLRQLAKAALEADVDADFVVVVVVDFFVDDDADGEALPQAASNTPATATPRSAIETVRNFGRVKLESLVFPMRTSMRSQPGRSLTMT
jgi:hypothetical protein